MNIHVTIKKSAWLLIAVLIMGGCANTGKTGNAEFAKTIQSNSIGEYNGFTYEYWNQNGTGEATMGLYEDGTFEVTWNGIFNMLARYGERPGQNVKSVTYTVDGYSVTEGVSYLCVYGWTYDADTDDNLVEFYIVDNWKNYRPPGNDGSFKGTVTVDGDTYDIYTSIRENKPSIMGTQTFTQYWSVRRPGETRLSGTIDVMAHFDAWKELDMGFGDTMYEVSFCVEGYGGNSGGSGQAKVTTLSFNTQ